MRSLPTLRHELLIALALVFAGALLVAVTGVILLLPRFETPGAAVMYIAILLAADIAVFALFGRYLIQVRVLRPLERVIEGVEAIAAGDYGLRLPGAETRELGRMQDAVNRMTEGLFAHQTVLAANVRSLEETNKQLTEARDELVRAEKMASVGRLAAGIAHEVGNPLSAILTYLSVLKRGGGATDPAEVVAAAENEARRIDRIVRGLLEYARTREVRARPIVVNGVVEHALDLLSTQGRFGEVQLRRELGESLSPIVADPHQLEQVLVNLLLNATDALKGRPGSEIRVRTLERMFEPPESKLPARRRDDPPDVDYSHRRRFHQRPKIPRDDAFPRGTRVVEIAVADNGPGIPPDLLEQIFEPFVTTKEPGEGTGLGLAVAAGLVHAMGGTIRAESVLDGGTSFTIVLPAADGAIPEEA